MKRLLKILLKSCFFSAIPAATVNFTYSLLLTVENKVSDDSAERILDSDDMDVELLIQIILVVH